MLPHTNPLSASLYEVRELRLAGLTVLHPILSPLKPLAFHNQIEAGNEASDLGPIYSAA